MLHYTAAMHGPTPLSAFASLGLKNTQPRRTVMQALSRIRKQVSAYDLQRWMASKGDAMNQVTVYRVLDAFEKAGIVHKHPCDGNFSLCSIPDRKGHHGFLHCHDCGHVEEFCSEALCNIEHGIARKAGFKPSSHVSEIVGACSACSK
jgi:Fur family transcriptional regulator, ferric uptake regulator